MSDPLTVIKQEVLIIDLPLIAPAGAQAITWAIGLTATSYKTFARVGTAVYLCTATHTTAAINEPGVGANWDDFWYLFVQDGPSGAVGAPANLTANSFARGATGVKDVKGSTQTLSDAGAITGGFSNVAFDAGTKSSGTFTPNPVSGNLQKATNNGAHTLAAPTNSCSMIIKYTNGASAGAITFSGFAKVNGSITTTNGHKFNFVIVKIDGDATLDIVKMQ